MGIIFDDGRDKAVKAARLAKESYHDLEKSSELLRDISRKLYQIARELPKNTPKTATASIHRTMRHVEKGTRQTLIHMKKLDTHVRHIEDTLRHHRRR